MNLQILNDRQREAVLHGDGPLLVLAGAGSGKTRVLTHKIAYLIEQNKAYPSEILSITFTNKAAGEMKQRIGSLIGEVNNGIWVGTFHSMCVRILRRDAEGIGYNTNFVIYDTADQKMLIKNCLKQLNVDIKKLTPKMVLSRISDAKNDMVSPADFKNEYSGLHHLEVASAYELYQKNLRQNNAMDFDDLILNTLRLLRTNEDIRKKYQDKFKYIFVDEYQDTNKAQYELVHILAQGSRNICVVGDADQSIYGWRGADIRNIREFENDFKGAKIIQLEQNYRSTQNILNAANRVIENNPRRYKKKLWTDGEDGNKIVYYRGQDEYDEARFVVSYIKELIEERRFRIDDFAILYRTNAQSRVFESILRTSSIPYKIIGGHKFYERKEIKDALSYLRLIQNNSDDIAFLRIVNEPKRGIGSKTLEKCTNISIQKGISLFVAIKLLLDEGGLSKKAMNEMKEFISLIEKFTAMKESEKVSQLLEDVLYQSGYKQSLEMDMSLEAQSRLENLEQLSQSILEFENNDGGNLEQYLSEISLVADVDDLEESDEGIKLMTLHSSKGLEFPVVFLVGMEEGIFPTSRAFDDQKAMEEERRLAYVGMTRAEKILCVSHAYLRNQFGKTSVNPISRFIEEIPEHIIDSNGLIIATRKENFQSSKKGVGLGFGVKKSPKKSSVSSHDIKAGVKVRHKAFGEGMVVEVSGSGDKAILTIAFHEKGIKKLQLGIAPIEIM